MENIKFKIKNPLNRTFFQILVDQDITQKFKFILYQYSKFSILGKDFKLIACATLVNLLFKKKGHMSKEISNHELCAILDKEFKVYCIDKFNLRISMSQIISIVSQFYNDKIPEEYQEIYTNTLNKIEKFGRVQIEIQSKQEKHHHQLIILQTLGMSTGMFAINNLFIYKLSDQLFYSINSFAVFDDFIMDCCSKEIHGMKEICYHLKQHYSNGTNCKLCFKSCVREQHFLSHFGKIRKQCPYGDAASCKHVYKHYVDKHKLNFFKMEIEQLQFMRCAKCKQQYKDIYELRQHLIQHITQISDESQKKIICSICGMRFRRNRQLSSHIISCLKKFKQITKKQQQIFQILDSNIYNDSPQDLQIIQNPILTNHIAFSMNIQDLRGNIIKL